MPKKICILGATGSVGRNTLSVLNQHLDQFEIFVLTAHSNIDLMLQQCQQYQPTYAVIRLDMADTLREMLQRAGLKHIQVLSGIDACSSMAEHEDTDIVVSALVGAAGLQPTFAAIQAGKRVLIANKEPLVMAGDLLVQAARESHALLLPLDSEHNAIFQSLPMNYGAANRHIKHITLTASGGPLLNTPLDALPHVQPEQACQHPNWSMGAKISVDSATMMNKGLELIEAMKLFALDAAQISILIHKESIVHSLVEFTDHAVIAQMSTPDMRIPIAHALAWPERMTTEVPRLNLARYGKLHFDVPDEQRFPCLTLAKQAAVSGGYAPVVLNAANEIAVAAFLNKQIAFTDIALIVEACLKHSDVLQPDAPQHICFLSKSGIRDNIAQILAIDHQARHVAQKVIAQHRHTGSTRLPPQPDA